MKRFEYQEIEYSHYPSPEELDEEGKEGWELIYVFPTEKKFWETDLEYYNTKKIYKATFKREL
jgi:hypothetical protein